MGAASERSSVFERVLIAPEVTPGTTIPTTKALLATKIDPQTKTLNKAFGANGSRWNTVAVQEKEWTEAPVTQDILCVTDLSYLLSMMFGMPSITIPGGGTLSREHLWNPPTWNAMIPKTFTVETGQAVQAMKFGYGVLTDIGIDFKRDGVSLSGAMIGQKATQGITMTPGVNEIQTLHKTGAVTAGTFPLTFLGESTTQIAFGATAGTIQTALLLLPNLTTGDVVVTGGPAGTADVIFTFGGRYASLDVALIIVGQAALVGGGSYDITQTTPGAPVSELAQIVIGGDDWDFYIDTTAAGLGVTKLTKTLDASFNIKGVYGPAWFANTTVPGFTDMVDLTPTAGLKFKVAADATGMAYLTNLRQGDTIFPRIKATGGLIEGALNYLAQFDFAVKIMDINKLMDSSGIVAVEYTTEINNDSTWTKAMSVLVRNQITAIV